MEDDLDWDELLLFIRDGRVVPVIGSHLLRVEIDVALGTSGSEPLDVSRAPLGGAAARD